MPPSTPRAVIDTGAPTVDQSAIRTLVHKRLPENVLLTDLRACSADRYICTGRMPTDHPLFNDNHRTPREDILFYTEVGRQASLAVSHAFLDVSLDDVFIFEGSEAALTEAIWRPPQPSPSDSVVIEINVRETIRRKHHAVSRVTADHLMTVGGEHVFGGTGTWTIQPAALFKRLRRTSLEIASQGSPEPPRATIGRYPDARRSPGNGVISRTEYRQDRAEVSASLIVDRTHPYFFDHPCDHVPGMLLLEGCAQLALEVCAESGVVAVSRRPAIMAYEVDFTQFVECDLPTSLTARVTGDHRVPGAALLPLEVVISQRGVVAGTARMSIGLSL